MPRVEVPAEHHDFIGFIGSRDLAHHVIAGLPFRILAVDDVEFDLDVFAIGQQPFDPAEIFITHHYGRQHLRRVVFAILKGPHQAVLHARVVDA
jgi:hypothetical protein